MEKDILLFLAGLFVGSMNSIAGGGMLVGFPVLLAYGLTPLAANVTSNIVILPGSFSSAVGYRKYLRKLHPQYLLLLVPCLVGGVAGALLLRNTPSDRFQELVPALVLFAVVLFAFQPYLHMHLHRHIRKRNKALQPLMFIGLALLPVATYGGYFGAGFGFIMLAFLGFTKIHEIHMMNALKNLASVSIASMSFICLVSTGLINWEAGLCMAAGSTLGGYYGSIFAQKVPTHATRIIVIAIGLCTATYLALRSY
jgi:uncharacterized membrane protein YfcA